mgnify:CR=1 FL=1
MENLTRREIEKCFLALLREKDVERVTVSDIAARCGINRNTFYYHFHDIPSLLEAVTRETVERFFSGIPADISLAAALERFYSYLEENRQLISCLFSQSRRNLFRKGAIGDVCGSVAG